MVIALLSLVSAGLHDYSLAADCNPLNANCPTNWVVGINGQSPQNQTINAGTDTNGNNIFWMDISGVYPIGTPPNDYSITITPKCQAGSPPYNVARIESGDDVQGDFLALKNVQITVSKIISPIPDNLISFQATFTPAPITDRTQSPQLKAGFRVEGTYNGITYGTLTRGISAAVGDRVRSRGSLWYENPAGSGNWQQWLIQDSTFYPPTLYIELYKDICTGAAGSACATFFTAVLPPSSSAYPSQLNKVWDSTSAPIDLVQGPPPSLRKLVGEFYFKITDTRDVLTIGRGPQPVSPPTNPPTYTCTTSGAGVQVKNYGVLIPPPGGH